MTQDRDRAAEQRWGAVLRRLPAQVHFRVILLQLASGELRRRRLLEEGKLGPLGWLGRILWWLAAAGVAVIPTSPDRAPFYFPAVFGLAVAWLVAAPTFAQSLADGSADFSSLRPTPDVLVRMLSGLMTRPDLPPALRNEPEVAAASENFAREIPALLPQIILGLATHFAWRAAVLACLAVAGMIAGPWLSEIHIGSLGGWSPVAVLYATTAPTAAVLVMTMVLPVFGYAYIAARRADLRIRPPHPDDKGSEPPLPS